MTLWRDDFYPDRPVVGLVGRLEPRPVDLERVAERGGRAARRGARSAARHAARARHALRRRPRAPIADDFAGAPLNTDDRPLIEFLAPRLTRMGRTGDKDWFVGEALAAFYDRLLARDPDVAEVFEPASPAVDRRAACRVRDGPLRDSPTPTATTATAARLQDEVRETVPEVIAAAESRCRGRRNGQSPRRSRAGSAASKARCGAISTRWSATSTGSARTEGRRRSERAAIERARRSDGAGARGRERLPAPVGAASAAGRAGRDPAAGQSHRRCLLVAGGSLLEKYAFQSPRVTVPDLLASA